MAITGFSDINYAKGWRRVKKDNQGYYVRLFGDKWYHEELKSFFGKRIWVDSLGWDGVDCFVLKYDMWICRIEG